MLPHLPAVMNFEKSNGRGEDRGEEMTQKLTLLTLVVALSGPTIARSADIDWKKVDAALGKTAVVAGEVHRYALARSDLHVTCLLYTSPSPRDGLLSRMPSSA